MTVNELPPDFYRILAVLFGLLWGSFLNVVIYRVPRDMSVVHPPSHCPACGAPVKAWLNVPVLSYIILRGRAGCCGAKMSPRYPLVEAIGGLLSWGIVEVVILNLDPLTPIWHAGAVFVAYFAVALGLVAAAFIDIEHMYLPDGITLGGTVIGIATATLRGTTFVDVLVGAAVGFLIVWVPFDLIYSRLRGAPGMGLGDAKLMALAGAWFGWPGALFVLGAGAIQGTAVTFLLLISGRGLEEPEAVKEEREAILKELEAMSPEEREEAERELANDPLMAEAGEGVARARIAFGPFLVLATLEFMFFGQTILSWIAGPGLLI